ncbi:acyloxyacyl hydrolase [Leptobacterium flavescens]|uniref:Acyloxyacyl hydrolase n=1 Tax=Leptobacterium flavescens TaxID=472055 RepID=A0A6P0UKU9_9FLAO|nr:acyloxyacyl hydrolase [Leptobacterium flavescens]NER12518.1 acyloxyacyl hydrolase [Leptobacterium flavescens]
MRPLFIILTLSLTSVSLCFSQEKQYANTFDINYFYGNIALHNEDIQHLITGHPEGLILGWNRKTFGAKDWEQYYNYPDYGASFIYQNLKNEFLGENYGVYAHYNFYFLNRNLMLRIGQGLAVTTNPYDKVDNFRNIAFGTRVLSSTYALLNYKKENIFDRFGLQAGLAFIHYSNANIKAPNTSINSITLNIGVTYNLEEEEPEYLNTVSREKFTEPIKFNLAFRTGVNESDVIDSGVFPFYIFSAYADKRINRKSSLQLGTEIFFSNFLKEHIEFQSIAFPQNGIEGDEDFKRVGVFVGHELFINRYSVLTQIGYYAYYPVDFEGRTYLRAGIKRYFGKKIYGALTLKSHGAKAENVEFGIGIRL